MAPQVVVMLVPCCERRDPWRNARRAKCDDREDTDKAGIENQIRQLKQALITLPWIKRHALPQVAGQIGTVP